MLEYIIKKKINDMVDANSIVSLMDDNNVCMMKEKISWLRAYQLLLRGWTPLPF